MCHEAKERVDLNQSLMRSLSPLTDHMNDLIMSSIEVSEIGKVIGHYKADGEKEMMSNEGILKCLKSSIDKIQEIKSDLNSLMTQKNRQYDLQDEQWTEVVVQPAGLPTFA